MIARDCPLCGDAMKLRVREVVERVPGTAQGRSTTIREWVCPGCDYFEESEEAAG